MSRAALSCPCLLLALGGASSCAQVSEPDAAFAPWRPTAGYVAEVEIDSNVVRDVVRIHSLGGETRVEDWAWPEVLVAGLVRTSDTPGQDHSWFGRYEPTGKAHWERVLLNFTSNRVRAIARTRDGGLVAVGEGRESASGDDVSWALKLDDDGEPDWMRRIPGGAASDVTVMEEGGFVVAGNAVHPWALRLDARGEPTWWHELRFASTARVRHALGRLDGGVELIGDLGGAGEPLHVFLLTADAHGRLLRQFSMPNDGGEDYFARRVDRRPLGPSRAMCDDAMMELLKTPGVHVTWRGSFGFSDGYSIPDHHFPAERSSSLASAIDFVAPITALTPVVVPVGPRTAAVASSRAAAVRRVDGLVSKAWHAIGAERHEEAIERLEQALATEESVARDYAVEESVHDYFLYLHEHHDGARIAIRHLRRGDLPLARPTMIRAAEKVLAARGVPCLDCRTDASPMRRALCLAKAWEDLARGDEQLEDEDAAEGAAAWERLRARS